MGHPENRLSPQPQDHRVTAEPARIGPNAILRVAESLDEICDPETRERVFEQAGLARYLEQPPQSMVDEREVSALHQTLRKVLGLEQARRIGRDAGLRTGDYLLGNRIPPFAQRILKLSPATLAERLLLKAITRNAWTFAGSASFTTQPGHPTRLILVGSRVCQGATASEPLCDFYAATFERLFRELVDPRTQVVEVQCQGKGDPECVFNVQRGKSNWSANKRK
jgi:divinyl protochlorophyllide a 8-vinyl-reductase